MTNNKQQTGINEVEYIIKVNQFAKENNTDKPRQQTAVEWLWNQLPEILPFTVDTETAVKLQEAYKQAKEMEKEQIINAFTKGIRNANRMEATKDAEEWYNETFNTEEK